MMSKVLIGIVIGVIVALPIGVSASYEAKYPQANVFMDIPYAPNTVSVFDDGDFKCYVARGGYEAGREARTTDISCVKK